MSDYTASADNCIFADRHAANDGGVAADRGTALNERGDAGPICFGLQFSGLCCRARVPVVGEHYPVANEDAVLYSHASTNKAVTRYLDTSTYLDALCDLYECADLGFVANLAPIEVREGIYFYIAAQYHIGCDAHKIRVFH